MIANIMLRSVEVYDTATVLILILILIERVQSLDPKLYMEYMGPQYMGN